MRQIKADDFISALLRTGNNELAKHQKSDVVLIKSPIKFGLDQAVRHEIENLHGKEKDRSGRLSVLIETTGGYIEVVERIYNVFRKHYEYVEFIVPNFAYSAGTVLVLSGDEIYMDYYSILGPIDPQFESQDGQFVPGLGYLQKFEELLEKINAASDPQKVRAELAYLLNNRSFSTSSRRVSTLFRCSRNGSPGTSSSPGWKLQARSAKSLHRCARPAQRRWQKYLVTPSGGILTAEV